jgi:tRNA(Ile)-lysidine synthase TilS/MesJ
MGKPQGEIEADKLRKKVGRAIEAYKLLGKDDRLMVGLSGGIDSLVMLDILSDRRKHLPFSFHLEAIHVYMEDLPDLSDRGYLKELGEKLDITLHLERQSTHRPGRTKKSMCFSCSWNRRKAIFQKAADRGCNKVVFAHHMDDALATLLMNMTFHGEMSSIPPKLSMFNGRFDLIRPMILASSDEINHYAALRNLHPAERECPWEDKNHRNTFHNLVQQMSQLHPQARINLFNSMDNIFAEYLPEKPV